MLKQNLLEWVTKKRLNKLQVSEDYSVVDYLEKIVEYFDATKAGDRKMTVVYEFHDSGKNDGVWTISIADGICRLTEGEAELYDTKVYTTAEVYRRILTGRLDYARIAYSVGGIRFFGNTLGHRELNEYLTLPKNARVAGL